MKVPRKELYLQMLIDGSEVKMGKAGMLLIQNPVILGHFYLP